MGALSVSAYAVSWNKSTDFAWNVGTGNITSFPTTGSGNIWASGIKTPAADGLSWKGAAKQLPFNPSPTLNMKAKFKPADMAKSIMKPGAGLLLPILAGSALEALMNQACVRLAGGTMQLNDAGTWEECHFTQQSTVRYWTGSDPNTVDYSQSSSCQAWATIHYSYRGATGQYANGFCTAHDSTGNYINAVATQVYDTQNVQVRDGWQPATSDKAEADLTTALNDWTQADFLYGYSPSNHNGGTAAVMDALMNGGASVTGTLDAPVVQTPIMEAPFNTVQSDPATGKTFQEMIQTQDDYSCIVIDPVQGAITCTQAKTTTKVGTTTTVDPSNPNGTATKTTTTTVITQTGDPNASDPCTRTPDAVGCMKIGTPSAADTLSKDTKTVTITPATFAGGACPAPVSFTVYGKSYQFTYDTLCAKLQLVSVLLLTLATFTAAWIFADGFRV